MPDKTKTTVVIESREQTIIRRTRRVISSHTESEGAVALLGRVSVDVKALVPGPAPLPQWRTSGLDRSWFTARCKAIALKTSTVLLPLSRRLKARANELKNRIS